MIASTRSAGHYLDHMLPHEPPRARPAFASTARARQEVYIYARSTWADDLNRAFGLTWDLSGWLLTPFMAKAGMEVVGRMRARVAKDLTTTFASHYKAKVGLEDMLSKEVVSEYNAPRTGEKYLVVPNG